MNEFQEYKLVYNDGTAIEANGEVEEALKRVEEYQMAYHQVLEQLEDERRLI